MTTIDPVLPASTEDDAHATPRTWWTRADQILERASEWVNPILVKEARQALKSRQFAVTFMLLLVFGLGWSMVGVAIAEAARDYTASGPLMLSGYFWILAFPMIVIVPFSAYRSLATEREDGTFELLSITSLKARQIVGGKLGSAVLQMIVYYSAVSPCIAFTYLLRGVDIITIVSILGYTFIISVLLSIAGLFLATVTRVRHVQVIISVAIILGLGGTFIGMAATVASMLEFSAQVPYDDIDFWLFQGTVLTAGLSYGLLLFLAAASAISFASENRSTKLRMVMVFQQLLLIVWIVGLWISRDPDSYIYGEGAVLAGGYVIGIIHWWVMGAIMVGESPKMSQRVARGLPQSVMGRLYLSLFSPGPGTGLMFTAVNSLALLLSLIVVVSIGRMFNIGGTADYDTMLWGAILLWMYMVAYLGVGSLLLTASRYLTNVTLLLGLLVNILLPLVVPLGTLTFQQSVFDYPQANEYSILQIVNPMWTTSEIARLRFNPTNEVVLWIGTAIVSLFTVSMLAASFLINSREFRRQRAAAPSRVTRDDRELHPERFEEPGKPKSPWDDD